MRCCRRALCALLLAAALAPALLAQPAARGGAKAAPAPIRSQSLSSITYSAEGRDKQVEITNVAYQTSGTDVPGRPPAGRLLLRTTTHSKEVLGDKGIDATVTVEAWPLGVDLKQKPLYSFTLIATGAQIIDNALWVAARDVDPDVPWWSVHTLGAGRHLFDTYVDLLRFQIPGESQALRYAGIEVPPDDTPDVRLKEPHVVGVVAYASAERVIREVLITCDDPKRAQQLRSYWDETRTMSLTSSHALRIAFSGSYPGALPDTKEVLIPIAHDDLDPARAQLSPGLRASPWRR